MGTCRAPARQLPRQDLRRLPRQEHLSGVLHRYLGCAHKGTQGHKPRRLKTWPPAGLLPREANEAPTRPLPGELATLPCGSSPTGSRLAPVPAHRPAAPRHLIRVSSRDACRAISGENNVEGTRPCPISRTRDETLNASA
ncbi:hypothetical protein D1007_34058 [Hordeum vulgare]|nr:hypothetical protein D1007_34058 [Hordeum vulgare]